ncbi:MAG: undecaprenyl/decaprenyl-phosphate alpha-N-acetylglucosaminyl 1-phosphate transferase [Chitinispirillaceae bacterium]|nr:undecaprenyl/decaprenyl-phosphate alpha-N-acetylglucosaminyl 1-phosphate transferase [Chitinispirillaceae bacterium]
MNTITFTHLSILFAGSFLTTAAGIYLFLKTSLAGYFIDKPDKRKVHRKPIPRLGGIVVVTSTMLFLGIVLLLDLPLTAESENALPLIRAILFASGVILITGFFDDTTFFTVRVRHKLLAELTIAFITVVFLKIHIKDVSFFNLFTLPAWLEMPVSFLWIIGLANAYNLIDGLDGLAGSIALLSFLTIGITAGITGTQPLLTGMIVIILLGSVTGFLLHNLPPAKTFMGDTGSIFLGTMVAILTLFLGKEAIHSRTVIVLPLIAGLPILEVFVTMVRRYFKTRDKKKSQAECLHSMVIPDNSHIHHRLMYKGYSSAQSLTLILILALSLSCGAVLSIILPTYILTFLLFYLFIPVYFTLYQLGFGGRFNKALRLSPTRYNGFRKQSLIGVIDTNGSLSEMLEKKSIHGVTCINISENDIPELHRHLRAAVLKEGTFLSSDTTIKKAEELSWLLKGPVFVVDDSNSELYTILEVSKNGTLSILEKTATVDQLLKELQQLSTTERIRHSIKPMTGSIVKDVQYDPLPVC